MENSISDKVIEVSEYLDRDERGAIVVPVDLSKILKKFNLSAYDIHFKRDDVSGAFDREKREIYLNATDPYTKKVFTLAHELGHYFLHQEKGLDVLYREKHKRGEKDDIEKEADDFAAELLMPAEAIRFYWPVAEGIQQLADIFSVSYVAMKNRLHSLGLL